MTDQEHFPPDVEIFNWTPAPPDLSIVFRSKDQIYPFISGPAEEYCADVIGFGHYRITRTLVNNKKHVQQDNGPLILNHHYQLFPAQAFLRMYEIQKDGRVYGVVPMHKEIQEAPSLVALSLRQAEEIQQQRQQDKLGKLVAALCRCINETLIDEVSGAKPVTITVPRDQRIPEVIERAAKIFEAFWVCELEASHCDYIKLRPKIPPPPASGPDLPYRGYQPEGL